MFSSVHIHLASASPQRRRLLSRLGVSYQCCPAHIDETRGQDEAASDYVLRMAEEKALMAQNLNHKTAGEAILAADTIISIADDVFGKPQDRTHAKQMLTRLAGDIHRVMTAVVLLKDNYCAKEVNISQVTFTALSETTIDSYLDTGEYRDKAGAYAIQGLGEAFIERIEGSFSGIMGLPLHTVTHLFKQAGLWSD